jgi:thioredoxin 1
MNPRTRLVIVCALVVAVVAVVVAKHRASENPPPSAPAAPQSVPAPAAPSDALSSTASALAAPLPRLVDLGSTTCIPCQMMAPILEQLQKEESGRFAVEVIDVYKSPAAAEQHGVKLIPTQIFFDAAGKELWRHEGFISKDEILAKWKELGFDLEKGASGAETR